MRLSQKYGTVKIRHIELAVRRAVEMPLINSKRAFRPRGGPQAAIDTFIKY